MVDQTCNLFFRGIANIYKENLMLNNLFYYFFMSMASMEIEAIIIIIAPHMKSEDEGIAEIVNA